MNIETNRFAGTGSVTAGSRPVETQKTTPGVGRAPNSPLTVSVTAGHPLGRLIDGVMNLPPPPIPEELTD